MKVVSAYVDGSFADRETRWALVVVDETTGEKIHEDCGKLAGLITEMYQVGGELKGAIEAVCYGKRNDCKVNIHYDMNGICEWCGDIVGKKPWKANKTWTRMYAAWMRENRHWIDGFTKVKGHSGNKWNEEADKLCLFAERISGFLPEKSVEVEPLDFVI